jgi:hypothetical protein
MSIDATIDRLNGARILKAVRRKHCIELDTDKGVVIVGSIREHEERICFGCGEERMVSVVETGGRKEASCGVCGHFWDLG